MRESFYIHLKTAEGTRLAGQCIRDSERGQGWFRYAPRYLGAADSYPLDPINLPLDDKIKAFPYDRENPGVPGVLLDCGPDAWGKKFLAWYRQPPPATAVEYLLAGSGTGVGALRFTSSKEPPPPDAPVRPFECLEAMLEAATAAEQNQPATAEQESFFQRGSSVGGARPKTLIFDDGVEWIAKFPRLNDRFDNPLIEHLTMALASKAGVETAETRLANTAQGRVLLVKRFDWNEGVQSHFISFNSLINVFSLQKRREEDFSYENIARLTNQICKGSCGEQVYRRMIFNVAVGNTDDHMHNHALLKRPNEPHYKLSPAYDLVPHPDLLGSHSICVGPMGMTPNKDNLLAAAKSMHISHERLRDIIAEVYEVTRSWQLYMEEGGVAANDIAQVGRCFEHGQRVLASMLS